MNVFDRMALWLAFVCIADKAMNAEEAFLVFVYLLIAQIIAWREEQMRRLPIDTPTEKA